MTYRIVFPHDTSVIVKTDGSAAFVAAKLNESIGLQTPTGTVYNPKMFMSIQKMESGTYMSQAPNLTDLLIR